MIFLNGTPFLNASSSSSEESDTLLFSLMKDHELASASNSFKAMAERKFSAPEESVSMRSEKSKWVYLFQREYATVDPSLVDFVGTDEATTCVGLAIWNRKNGKTSFSHMDSPKIVDMGLDQMLSKFLDYTIEDDLDVHIVGAFEDISPELTDNINTEGIEANPGGYSVPLCSKLVESLRTRPEKFHLKTLCVLEHNTRRDSEGTAYPVFTGFVVETSTGSVIPASFDRNSRCPDEIVRRIRVTAAYEDHKWSGKLLDTYHTQTDRFEIAPCRWSRCQEQIAWYRYLMRQPDEEVLQMCSTSPLAESPDFVQNERRKWEYLIQHPDWRETFLMGLPRIFERTAEGGWKSSSQGGQSASQLASVSESNTNM